jgi:succinoglycan biosynthesis protein ExoM
LPEITFLICTVHREELLIKLLHTVLALHGLDTIEFEILIIDNSDKGSAQKPVEAFAEMTQCPQVRYVQAHPPNIAVARNVGVTTAKGRFVAMIDDDMVLDRTWLQGIADFLADESVDVICGPVEPLFENPALATPDAHQFFNRDAALPAGAELLVMGPRRTRGFVPATSNSIFRRATCLADEPCFDMRYGRTGGEDVDLLCRLQRRGRRFVWAAGARTFEIVPVHRCSPTYLEQRSYSGGQIFAATYVRNSPHPWWVATSIAVIAMAQLLIIHLGNWVKPPHTEADRQSVANRRAAVRGKLFWWQMFPLYATEHQSQRENKGTN